jgi:hypothetical protein
VVETSIGVSTSGAGNGVGALGNRLVADVWGRELDLLGTTRHKRGLWWEVGAYTGIETSVGTRKLDKAIEMSYSDYLAHNLEVCKDTPSM